MNMFKLQKRRLRRTLLFTIRRLVMARLSKSIAKFNELRALNGEQLKM